MLSINDLFEIKNGELIKYKGTDGSVFIPDSAGIKVIKRGAFDRHETFDGDKWIRFNGYLYQLRLPEGLTKIEDDALNRKWFKELILPSTVTEIGKRAFYICEELESISIPAGVTSVKASTFQYCEKLKNVTFDYGSRLATIDLCAFSQCASLTSITIPDSVTKIDEYAFSNCENLSNITFGYNSQLKYIGKYAFSCCKKLTYINLPKSVTFIDDYAFDVTGLKEVTPPHFCQYSELKKEPYAISRSFPLGCRINLI